MKALIVPIDNRPVTYIFPQLIGRIAGVEMIAPPRQMMGSLSANTSVDDLSNWLSEKLASEAPDCLLICLDSIIYGGLIPSRRITATTQEMMSKLAVIKSWKKLSPKKTDIYAQSSIMRISDNYDNVEEKQYWSEYGRDLFSWSAALHRLSLIGLAQAGSDDATTSDAWQKERTCIVELERRTDPSVRKDYLGTRMRNFQVNKALLEYAASGAIDHLVFSQDDSGQFGLNVMEKNKLVEQARQLNLKNVIAYAGADEVVMSMLGRWLVGKSPRQPIASVSFSPAAGREIASRYEGQTIGQSVEKQLAAVGLHQDNNSGQPDLHVIVHTSGTAQGDHIHLPELEDMRFLDTTAAAIETMAKIESSSAPVILCDVAYANGSDPILLERLLCRPDLLKKLWGYAGWNTTGNTLGSALATGVARWYGQINGVVNSAKYLQEALLIRLADDFAYQTQVRKELHGEPQMDRLTTLLTPHLHRIADALEMPQIKVESSFPWARTFEVEIDPA